MKKGSIIILIIAILVIIAGIAIYMITNQNSTNNSSINDIPNYDFNTAPNKVEYEAVMDGYFDNNLFILFI